MESAEPTSFYCVYRLGKAIGDSADTPSDLLTTSRTKDLQIFLTDMQGDTESRLKLRKTISQMAERNLIHDSGSVGFLRNLMPGTVAQPFVSSGTFYSALVATPFASYIVCLISLSDTHDAFALFRSDLDRTVRGISALLTRPNVAEGELREKLTRWYTDSFKYLTTAVLALRVDALAPLLHSVFSGKQVTLSPAPASDAVASFLDTLAPGLAAPHAETDAVLHRGDVVSLVPTPSGYGLSSKETNPFCVAWAEALVSLATTGDYIAIRQQTEFTKLQIHQEVAAFAKLLEAAVSDNYALFECLAKLKKHRNRDILLITILRSTGSKDLQEVLECLYECGTAG